MAIIKKITVLFFVSFLFIQCSKDNEFVVEKGKVGFLTQETTVKELISIFKNDSIVTQLSKDNTSEQNFIFTDADLYEIYSKSGEKLLEITPTQVNDSTSKIKSIQIFNSNYKNISSSIIIIVVVKNRLTPLSIEEVYDIRDPIDSTLDKTW